MKTVKKITSVLCVILSFVMLFPAFASAEENQTAQNTMTINVCIDETSWESVNIHYWGGAEKSSWPGVGMTEGEDGIYAYSIPDDSTGIIFNNGSDEAMEQSVDVTDIREDVIYHVQPADGGKASVVMKDKEGNVIEPEEPQVDMMEIRFDNSVTKWNSVSMHYWGSGVTGTDWPGLAMEPVEGQENIYRLEVPVGITGIVFVDPSDPETLKSSDVTDIPTRAEWEENNDISAEYISVGYEYGKYAVLRKDENGNVYQPPQNPNVEESTAQQVNTHVGEDYTSVYLSYTTVGETEGKVVLTSADGEVKQYTAEKEYSPSAQKYQYKALLDGLKPDMGYTYTIGDGDASFTGTFTSLPESGSDKTLKFAYLADTQVASATDAEAANATFNFVNQYSDLAFVYVGGDLTDNAESKLQWESLFKSENGQYPEAGAECLSNNLLAVCQGNHDKNHDESSLSGYVNVPDEGGNLVYSIDYGNVRFIVLNSETAVGNEAERDSQKAYLEKEVNEAKAAGQWTIVAFHKSIYSGGSHIVDSDIIEARKFWAPVLADLDVDAVLQAHDHVMARGFINGDGTRGAVEQTEDGAYISQDNTPLYMVGGHAGGLKWYSAIDYTVNEGDPLLPNYEFLDVSSTWGENGTDKTHESMYTIVEVTENEFKTVTYTFKYDQETHQVTEEPTVYDSVVITKEATVENGDEDQEETPESGAVNTGNTTNDSVKPSDADKQDTTAGVQMPKTGDTAEYGIYVIIMLGAAAAMAAVYVKKNYKQR